MTGVEVVCLCVRTVGRVSEVSEGREGGLRMQERWEEGSRMGHLGSM